MRSVPVTLTRRLVRGVPLFSQRVWEHAQGGVVGARLAPGKRPVTAVLRGMGLRQEGQCQTAHRVRTRAQGTSRAVARGLWGVGKRTLASAGTVVRGSDETRERRRGEQLQAKDLSRAPVRSARSLLGKASGGRWLGALRRSTIPWAGRGWAVPLRTALGPAERSQPPRGQRPKPLPQGVGQRSGRRHRWCPGREVGGGRELLRRPRTTQAGRRHARRASHPPLPVRGGPFRACPDLLRRAYCEHHGPLLVRGVVYSEASECTLLCDVFDHHDLFQHQEGS
jgi:hypothetical protein